MRERDINRKLFMKGHYEIIAKRFRDALTPYLYDGAPEEIDVGSMMEMGEMNLEASVEYGKFIGARNALVSLAVEMATRFQADSEEFDGVIFMTRCSPDPVNFPLGEIWEELSKQTTGE